jgi:hypothetical protein
MFHGLTNNPVLNTDDYKHKVTSLVEDTSYRKLDKYATEKTERKTARLLKNSSLTEDIKKQLLPSGSRPPRLYGLRKIHKVGVPLRPTVNNIGAATYKLSKYLTSLLNQLTGKSTHHVRNSLQFVQTLNSLRVQPEDMVSFDVVPLFIKVPISDTLQILGQHFEENLLVLFRHVLTSTYFCFEGQFFEQTDGVAMGSPLSPVVANFFMEDFEKRAIEQATNKPTCWFRYVDDTFVIWQHGQEKLTEFLSHLNSLHDNIQFVTEKEEDGHLQFLDIDIYRKPNGSLGHRVYRKPTHTTLYLHHNSHHHPSYKISLLTSLIHGATAICDQDSLNQGLVFLTTVFEHNG